MIFRYDPVREKEMLRKLIDTGRIGPVTAKLLDREFGTVQIEDDCQFMTSQIKICQENWEEVEQNFLEQMTRFFEKKCDFPENMTCYLIRYGVYPYYYSEESNWFNAPLFSDPSERNRVIMHEMCHYFTPKNISRSLKEAIPVILNDHETYQMFAKDRGHQNDPEEMRLRPIIFEKFKEGKTFPQILQEINLLPS